MRKNLISTPFNIALTVLIGAGMAAALVALVRFIAAADFTILRVNLALFVVGGFPRDQLWRVAASLSLLGRNDRSGGGPGLVGSGRQGSERPGCRFHLHTSLARIARRFWPLALVILVCLSLTQTPGPAISVVAALVVGVIAYWAARAVQATPMDVDCWRCCYP